MARICSNYGPRYPVYNDKRGRVSRSKRWYHWYAGNSWNGPNHYPAPEFINPILPRPPKRIDHKVIQPKANSGFFRGQRNFKKGAPNEIQN